MSYLDSQRLTQTYLFRRELVSSHLMTIRKSRVSDASHVFDLFFLVSFNFFFGHSLHRFSLRRLSSSCVSLFCRVFFLSVHHCAQSKHSGLSSCFFFLSLDVKMDDSRQIQYNFFQQNFELLSWIVTSPMCVWLLTISHVTCTAPLHHKGTPCETHIKTYYKKNTQWL